MICLCHVTTKHCHLRQADRDTDTMQTILDVFKVCQIVQEIFTTSINPQHEVLYSCRDQLFEDD